MQFFRGNGTEDMNGQCRIRLVPLDTASRRMGLKTLPLELLEVLSWCSVLALTAAWTSKSIRTPRMAQNQQRRLANSSVTVLPRYVFWVVIVLLSCMNDILDVHMSHREVSSWALPKALRGTLFGLSCVLF